MSLKLFRVSIAHTNERLIEGVILERHWRFRHMVYEPIDMTKCCTFGRGDFDRCYEGSRYFQRRCFDGSLLETREHSMQNSRCYPHDPVSTYNTSIVFYKQIKPRNASAELSPSASHNRSTCFSASIHRLLLDICNSYIL